MRKTEIPERIRYAVIKDREDNMSFRKIADRHGLSPSAACKIYNHYSEHKTLNPVPRSGRPHIYNERDHRALINLVKKNRRHSSTTLTQSWILSNGKKASPRTVRRLLYSEGFF
jgi:transposase